MSGKEREMSTSDLLNVLSVFEDSCLESCRREKEGAYRTARPLRSRDFSSAGTRCGSGRGRGDVYVYFIGPLF